MITAEEKLKELAEIRIRELGGFLVQLKVHPNRKAVIEFDKPDGVRISDCATLSRSLNQDPELQSFFESHELEVGSPGMDSPFRVREQYTKNVGRKIRVRTVGGEITGTLVSADENGIELQPVAEKKATVMPSRFIPYAEITEARKIITFS